MRAQAKTLGVVVVAITAMAFWAGGGATAAVRRQTTTTTSTPTAGPQAMIQDPLTIVAVFQGSTGPTSPLQIQRSCQGVFPPNQTFTVAAAGPVNTTDVGGHNSCTVTATATDGASSVSYA